MCARALIPGWSRSAWFRFLLVAALLFAQQGYLAHAVAHPFEARGAQQNGDGKPADRVCEQCLAHAQLAGTVGAAVVPWFAPVRHAPVRMQPAAAPRRVTLLHFQSRAPPRS